MPLTVFAVDAMKMYTRCKMKLICSVYLFISWKNIFTCNIINTHYFISNHFCFPFIFLPKFDDETCNFSLYRKIIAKLTRNWQSLWWIMLLCACFVLSSFETYKLTQGFQYFYYKHNKTLCSSQHWTSFHFFPIRIYIRWRLMSRFFRLHADL